MVGRRALRKNKLRFGGKERGNNQQTKVEKPQV
jgi:hypothetical protein